MRSHVVSQSAPILVLAVLALSGFAAAQQGKGPPAYAPPAETSHLLDGPGLAKAQAHCLACHSADYVNTQPRGMPEAFWTAEVAKMRTAYGARIPDEDVRELVAYLNAAYGAPHQR